MENKKNSKYNFIAQTLILYAVNILILVLISYFFGEGAKSISSMYSLGSKGLSTTTLLQFLISSTAIILLKTLCFSERIFKKMMTLWRSALLMVSVLVVMIGFIILFRWFPLNNIYAWSGFLICFGGGILICCLFMIIKTKLESRRYEELLSSYRNNHGGEEAHE